MPLRSLTDADLAAVLSINNDAVPAVGALDEASLRHLVGISELALVATSDVPELASDSVVGFCIVLAPGADYGSVNYRWFCERYDDFVYLDRVAIDPVAQGRGLGRELYERVEAATSATWFCLEVNVRPRNDASLAFHERLGFTEVGQQDTDYGARVSMHAKRLR